MTYAEIRENPSHYPGDPSRLIGDRMGCTALVIHRGDEFSWVMSCPWFAEGRQAAMISVKRYYRKYFNHLPLKA